MPKTSKKSSRKATVKPVSAAPRINPTENITSYGSIAGSQDAAKKVVTCVSGDDWEGLFIDGVLVEENHSLRAFHVLDALAKAGIVKYEEIEANQDTLEGFGSFSKTLEENRRDGIIS